MATMVEDVIKALNNLGGRATLSEIYAEVERIRITPLSQSWQATIRQAIEFHSSDSHVYKGKDLFCKIAKGTWALREYPVSPSHLPIKSKISGKPKNVSKIPESFETISNMLKTIKQYREYYLPTSPSWSEYIHEFFHVLGFSTEIIDSRKYFLKDMGENTRRKAVVYFVLPGEDFENLPGLTWEHLLLLETNFNQLDWGILTDGLQLKVFNYGSQKSQFPYFWPDLDEIIEKQTVVRFFEIFKIFSMIKVETKDSPPIKQAPIIKRTKQNAPELPKALRNILDVYWEISKNGHDYTQACKIITKKNNLSSPHTVPDACTRRIGINTDGFRKLVLNKTQLIDHLTRYYPGFSDTIRETLSAD